MFFILVGIKSIKIQELKETSDEFVQANKTIELEIDWTEIFYSKNAKHIFSGTLFSNNLIE